MKTYYNDTPYNELPIEWFNRPIKCWDLPCINNDNLSPTGFTFLIFFTITLLTFWYSLIIYSYFKKKGGDNK